MATNDRIQYIIETLPAGRYWIGDPCYVMHEVWDEVVNITFPDLMGGMIEGVLTLKDGRKFAIFSTAYGDGRYSSNMSGKSFGVDSGCLGCILLDTIDMSYPDNVHAVYSGEIFDIKDSFEPSSDGETIKLGPVEIYTGDEDDESEEEDEYDRWADNDDDDDNDSEEVDC